MRSSIPVVSPVVCLIWPTPVEIAPCWPNRGHDFGRVWALPYSMLAEFGGQNHPNVGQRRPTSANVIWRSIGQVWPNSVGPNSSVCSCQIWPGSDQLCPKFGPNSAELARHRRKRPESARDRGPTPSKLGPYVGPTRSRLARDRPHVARGR